MDEAAFWQAKVADLETKILESGRRTSPASSPSPVMASAASSVPPAGYHRGTLEVCRKIRRALHLRRGVTGSAGSAASSRRSRSSAIVPDIITCAKGLTSGLCAARRFPGLRPSLCALDGRAPRARASPTLHLFRAHPIACAAALTSLAIIEREHLCGHVREVGPYFIERLKHLATCRSSARSAARISWPCVEMRARQVDQGADGPRNGRSGNRIIRQAMSRGLIVRPMAHLVILSPPLIIKRGSRRKMGRLLHASILAVADELRQKGCGP